LLVNSRVPTIYTNHTIEYRPARFTLRVPIDATTDGATADGDRRERRSAARAVAVDGGTGATRRG
jgi:hypothetical protein